MMFDRAQIATVRRETRRQLHPEFGARYRLAIRARNVRELRTTSVRSGGYDKLSHKKHSKTSGLTRSSLTPCC